MKLPAQRSIQMLAIFLIVGTMLAGCGETAPPVVTPTQAPTPVGIDPAETAAPTATQGAPTERTKVRLGYIPVMIFAPLFVGIERGYFAEEGLDIELTALQGGSDSVVQLAAGNFDVAVGGAGAGLLNAAERGVRFKIVAPMHSERPPLTSPLVISAKRADEFKSVADLKGKKVAINATGAATEYWLAQALKKAGLTMNDIQLQTLAFRDVPAALENGSLDASILGEPLATINEDNGLVKVLSEDFIDGFTATYVYMGEPFMQNDKAARGFMRAYLRACRDLQGDYMDKDIATIIEKYTQVPADVALRSSPAQYNPNGVVPIEDLNTLQDYFLERGQLEYKEPMDLTRFVDTQLASEVAAELDKK
jgi:NitT/TauT family transport system substrate-binding protein